MKRVLISTAAGFVVSLIGFGAMAQEIGDVTGRLIGPTARVDWSRPEIVRTPGCTGTLIRARWVLTAAHCLGHRSANFSYRSYPNITVYNSSGGFVGRYAFERAFSLGYPIGDKDLALLHLQRAVPPDQATPASLADSRPRPGSRVTARGFGCGGGRDGQKQSASGRLEYRSGVMHTERILCQGDSGGPLLLGPSGPVVGVNSQFAGGFAVYASAYDRAEDLNQMMDRWDREEAEDVYERGWCTGMGDNRYHADVNGDRQFDMICHNTESGRVGTATGNDQLLRQVSDFRGPFCSHDGAQLDVGDFNGDGRTDILCSDMNNGSRWIAFASGNDERPYYQGGPSARFQTSFCTHDTARLHAGDFNGDGRTDLLCHDTANGYKRITHARHDQRAVFDGRIDWHEDSDWCSHDGADLVLGDYNGDGRTDLLCHTRSNGALDLRVGDGRGLKRQTTWYQHQARVCAGGSDRLIAADINADGRSDLICLDEQRQVSETILAVNATDKPFNIVAEGTGEDRHWSRATHFAGNGAEVRLWRMGRSASSAQSSTVY